jgi:threonine/homoserine/homoserine lactone efflux protein
MAAVLAMCGFALVMSVSPGPVNIITLTSGLNNGLGRTLPFVSGATVGFTALLALIGLGLSGLIRAYPGALEVLKYVGTGFILYMAVKMVRADPTVSMIERARPGFVDGVLLQWLNPKAWLACLSGVAAFTAGGGADALLLFCGLYFVICYAGISFWAVLGDQAKRLIRNPRQMKIFNCAMGGLLILTAGYLFVA